MNQELDAEQIDYMASLEAPTNQDQWVAPPWQGVGVSNYQAQSSHGIPTSLNDPYSSLGPNAAQHQYAQQPGVVSPSDLGGGDFVAGINGMNTAQLLDYGSIPRESTVDSISLPTDQEFLPDLTQQSRARW